MDTTEIIKDALDWADKRLDLQGEKLTENQRNYITFALRQNLVKNLTIPDVVVPKGTLCDETEFNRQGSSIATYTENSKPENYA